MLSKELKNQQNKNKFKRIQDTFLQEIVMEEYKVKYYKNGTKILFEEDQECYIHMYKKVLCNSTCKLFVPMEQVSYCCQQSKFNVKGKKFSFPSTSFSLILC